MASRTQTAPPASLRHGWAGLFLVAVFWPLNWLLSDESRRTAYLFFPLWLGYILIVDSLVAKRSGTSLWNRSRTGFAWLFVASAPAWWLFEAINHRTRNWEYLARETFAPWSYALLATLSFSTVMPAVFESAELVRTFAWTRRFVGGPRLQPSRALAAGFGFCGLAMLALTLLWPTYFYPFVWGAIFLLVEPINLLLRRKTCFDWLQQGDWRPVVSLAAGALLCGFFWEMWNFYSYPKWIYHTPGAQFLHVFEMPLLGYLGYIPFAWELHALWNSLWPNAPALRL